MEILFPESLILDQVLIQDHYGLHSVFQEQEKRNEVHNDYNNELSKAHKEIRDYHTKLERVLDKGLKIKNLMMKRLLKSSKSTLLTLEGE